MIDAGGLADWNYIRWGEGMPYGEALPNDGSVETAPGGANMTGNVLLLHMDESSGTIVDYSREGNNGTKSGGVTYSASGKFGTGLSFGGSDGYVDCGNDVSLQITDAITAEAWIKSTATGTRYMISKL